VFRARPNRVMRFAVLIVAPTQLPSSRGADLGSMAESDQARRKQNAERKGTEACRAPRCPQARIRVTRHRPACSLKRTKLGRVEMWRGGVRLGISVAGPFGCRCLTGLALTPFPHPAHQTRRAVFPHRAFGQGCIHILLHTFAHETVAAMFLGAGTSRASGTDSGRETVLFPDPVP
jgi:hypothetical protein